MLMLPLFKHPLATTKGKQSTPRTGHKRRTSMGCCLAVSEDFCNFCCLAFLPIIQLVLRKVPGKLDTGNRQTMLVHVRKTCLGLFESCSPRLSIKLSALAETKKEPMSKHVPVVIVPLS